MRNLPLPPSTSARRTRELFLNLISTTNSLGGVSATFDLGIPTVISQPAGAGLAVDPRISNFTPGKLSNAGIKLQWDLSGTVAWTSFVGTAGVSLDSTKFDIKAVGPSNMFMDNMVFLTTLSAGDPSQQDYAALQGFGDVGSTFVASTNTQSTHNSQPNGANFATAARPDLYHEAAVGDNWKNNLLFGDGKSTGAVGALPPLAFYQLWGTPDNAGGTAFPELYGGGWTLSKAGVLTYATAPVPEPGSWALVLAGLAAVGLIARRRAATFPPLAS